MLKKTIKYTDYNDNEREEDFYFNISKGELAMMESSRVGGFRGYLERIIKAQDNVAIMEAFRDLIRTSYGEKSPDGRRFIKSEELSTAFEQTEAYSNLIMEILSSEEAATKFVAGILPKDVVDATNGAEIKALLPNTEG